MSIAIDLSDRIALVTGASQGIGAESARTLHAAGATVLLNHPGTGNTESDCEAIALALRETRSDSAFALAADVADAAAVQALMASIQQRWGGLDLLINNAGILRDRTIAKMTLEEWHAVIDVNLSGVFHCCKYGLEVMRDGGAIVNLGSIAAILGFPGQTNYAAAKAGVMAMTRVLSRECAKRAIRVNSVAPGVVETPMALSIREQVKVKMLEQIPLGRFAQPREIADAVLFLCSDLAGYVTGQCLHVNGGWHG